MDVTRHRLNRIRPHRSPSSPPLFSNEPPNHKATVLRDRAACLPAPPRCRSSRVSALFSFFASRLPPSRDARNRWETTCIPFLSDIFVARPRVNRSFQSVSLASLAGCPRFSPFSKSRVANDRSFGCALLGVFPLCAATRACSANQRSRFMAEFIFGFYSRRREGRTANAWRGTDPPDYQSLVLTY